MIVVSEGFVGRRIEFGIFRLTYISSVGCLMGWCLGLHSFFW